MRSNVFYKAAKYNNDWRAVSSGSTKRVARRIERRRGWRLGTRLLKAMMK